MILENRERQLMKINGYVVGKIDTFKYLGPVLQENGGFKEDMLYRINKVTKSFVTKGSQFG